MREELISFETAKLAKEKGFDVFSESRLYFTTDGTPSWSETYRTDEWIEEHGTLDYYRPTQSLLQKWLREEHKIDVLIDSVGGIKGYYYSIQDVKTGDQIKDWSDKECIFEEALEKALQESLKLI